MFDTMYGIMLWVTLLVLSISLCFCLFRAILGPRFTDRIVAVNIICTKSIILIAVIAALTNSSFLLDIAIVYAMIGFLAVVVLSKCYLLKYQDRPIDPELEVKNASKKEESRE